MAYSDNIESQLITQYKGKTNFVNFLKGVAAGFDSTDIEIGKVLSDRAIDVAYGTQLDILGEIVGISREVIDFINPIYFGFDGDPTAKTFGEVGNPLTGGRYRSSSEDPVETRLLSDSEYRILIKAKIRKNSSDVTIEDVLSVMRLILTALY